MQISTPKAHTNWNPDLMVVNRLFHGIEAMTSLGSDEFNSLEISGGTLVPNVDKIQKYFIISS